MANPLFVFAHGAGAPSSHPFMRAWAARLATLGRVHTFDYAYMEAGRGPDRLPKLVDDHRAQVAKARGATDEPLVLIGKSMGSRVGCHVALEEPVAGLVCLGYPLVGAGKRQPVRDAVLLDLRTPILFVQGTRDRLCPLDRLEAARAKMVARSELHVVEDGDHSLVVTKRQLTRAQETQDDVDARILAHISHFVRAL